METLNSLHSVEAHVAGRAHASTCTAADYCVRRLVSSRSRASPHRRRWTPRCSEPGYGGVGVTVHPACDPSQPSVTQSDALPDQPKILYRELCAAAAAARVLAYWPAGKASHQASQSLRRTSHACSDKYITSPGAYLGAATRKNERWRLQGSGAAARAGGRYGLPPRRQDACQCFNSVSSKDQQTPAPVT